jgi:hypothetical protein
MILMWVFWLIPVLAGSRIFPIGPVPVPTQTHKVSLFLQPDHMFIYLLGLVERNVQLV